MNKSDVKVKLDVVVTASWTYVGVTHCAGNKYVSIYHDGLYIETPMTPSTYLIDGQTMTIAENGYSYLRIGDMVLSTNKCMTNAEYIAKQMARSDLPSCLPGNKGFYNTCGTFGLIIPPAFSGSIDLASTVTYPFQFSFPGAPGLYGVTLANQNFYCSGWVKASALSSSSIALLSIYTKDDALSLLASVSSGTVTLIEVWSFTTPGPDSGFKSTSCATPSSGYVYFYIQMEDSGGTNTLFTVCCQDDTTCVTETRPIVGGVSSLQTASAYFAQVPIYNAIIVPYTSSPVLNSAFFTTLHSIIPLNTVDPNCTWDGPKCVSCTSGYYLSMNNCKKCHPNCGTCSGDGFGRCLSCSAGYYMQPAQGSICMGTCPTGYSPSGVSCVRDTGNDAFTVNFIEHTSKNFKVSGQRVNIKNYYLPTGAYSVSDRGLYVNFTGNAVFGDNNLTERSTFILNTDFSYDIWVLPYGASSFIRAEENQIIDEYHVKTYTYFDFGLSILDPFSEPNVNTLDVAMRNYRQSSLTQSSDSPALPVLPQWFHLGVSVTYSPTTDQTSVVVLQDRALSTHLLYPSFIVTTVNTTYTIGLVTTSEMIVMEFTIANYPRILSDFLAQLGTCSECSVCPIEHGACLSTCLPNEYIEYDQKCVQCSEECSTGCSSANTCIVSTDPICDDWNTETATCTQCYNGAMMVNGRCQCEGGKVLQDTVCVSACFTGYYVARGVCTSCPLGCNTCSSTGCKICSPELLLVDGQCTCGTGWYLTSSLTCAQCSAPCIECKGSPTACTKCLLPEGYFLFNSTCVDCRSIPGFDSGLGLTTANLTGLSKEKRAQKVCKEICGDGLLLGQYACDDGNLVDGDGCSHVCEIETGWSCPENTCQDVSKPLPVLRYLNLTDYGYVLLLGFNETIQQVSTIPSLLSVTLEYIDLFSHSLEPYTSPSDLYSTYLLHLHMDESVPSGTKVTVTVPSSLTDFAGNHIAATEATDSLQDAYISKSTALLDLLVSGCIGVLWAMTCTGFIVSVLMNGKMDKLWSLVEAIQIANLLLYTSGKLPDNVRHFFRAFNFANLSVVPSMFSSSIWSDIDRAPYAFAREDMGVNFLLNISPVLLVWWVVVVLGVVVVLASWAAPTSKGINRVKESYRYSMLFRVAIETSLPTALAIALQLSDPEPRDTADPVSLATMAVAAVILCILPIFVVLKVTSKVSSKLKQEEHRLRYGSLYSGYKLSKRWKRSFLLIRLARKLAWVITLVGFSSLPTLQSCILLFISISYLTSLIIFRPFRERFTGILTHIIAQTIFTLSQGILLVFTLDDYTVSLRNTLGWCVISLISVFMLCYVVAYCVDFVLQILRRLSRLYQEYALEVMESMRLKGKSGDIETTVVHTEMTEVPQQQQQVIRPPRPLQRPRLKKLTLGNRKTKA